MKKCLGCGMEISARTRCDECRLKRKSELQKQKQDLARAEGRCITCLKTRAAKDKSRCTRCLKKNCKHSKPRTRATYHARKEVGLCVHCGGPKEGKFVKCKQCRINFNTLYPRGYKEAVKDIPFSRSDAHLPTEQQYDFELRMLSDE